MSYTIKSVFGNEDHGIIESKSGNTVVSFEGNALAPYELFLGGYVSCLHSTFKSIADKKRIPFKGVSYDVTGVKREEVPTLLKEVTTIITFTGVAKEKEKAIIKSMTLAERYCSISALINTIAEMNYEHIFK
ncbi:MAG: OsmC family protein [Candidatus Izimaplasma sp.]|nr:OsmC family protein [Candidatus Izimaplasma bacterium]